MAVRLSEPFMSASPTLHREIQDLVLRRGGSQDLAALMLRANEYARDKGDENNALRGDLSRLRAENAGLRSELARALERVKALEDKQR
jgi:hypothetical protein